MVQYKTDAGFQRTKNNIAKEKHKNTTQTFLHF